MRSLVCLTLQHFTTALLSLVLVAGCVDPYEPGIRQAVNVVVVDGTITNLAEPQVVRLSRSQTISGQLGYVPLSGAHVEVVVDSSQVVPLLETADPGAYQLPDGFRGEVGHGYQLRFQLPDGTRYASSTETMQAVPPIDRVYQQFNQQSIPAGELNGITAAHDFFVDVNDPADARNFYRWEWKLWERQEWCRSCLQGVYSMYNVIVKRNIVNYNFFDYYSGDTLKEGCYYPPPPPPYEPPFPNITYDYTCRTQCWEILYSYGHTLFADNYTNGRPLLGQRVAQVPFYQRAPCLVEIRQLAMTAPAYAYYQRLQEQTQKTGGLADTPPAAPVGNVHNEANSREPVVGYFTASAVAKLRYWLDRQDVEGAAPGLFRAINGREPHSEPSPPEVPFVQIMGGPPRPPTAVCVESNSRTPFKPEGWQE